MTAFLLLRSYKKFLEKTVADYAAAQGEGGDFKYPSVFEWNLPFKNPKAHDKIDFPYIVARIINGKNTSSPYGISSSIIIDTYFGVYCEGTEVDGFIHPDGAYDLLNLMEHVRIALFKAGVLDKKYKVEQDYTWEIPEEQPYPLWVGQSRSIWSIQSVFEDPSVDIHANKFDWE
jgi:hypothetical protein